MTRTEAYGQLVVDKYGTRGENEVTIVWEPDNVSFNVDGLCSAAYIDFVAHVAEMTELFEKNMLFDADVALCEKFGETIDNRNLLAAKWREYEAKVSSTTTFQERVIGFITTKYSVEEPAEIKKLCCEVFCPEDATVGSLLELLRRWKRREMSSEILGSLYQLKK